MRIAAQRYKQGEINQHNSKNLALLGKEIYYLELKLDRRFAELLVFGRQTSSCGVGSAVGIDKGPCRQGIAILTDRHLDLVSHRWILAQVLLSVLAALA